MKKGLNVLLVVMLCLGLIACGSESSDDKTNQKDSDLENNNVSTNEPDIISMDELYGTYVSTLDETISFIFTADEYAVNDKDTVVSCPVYRQEQGKDKTVSGAYSLEISGDVLTVVDYYGELLCFQIVVDDGNIVLKFLEEQYEGSFFDAPYFYGILSDLIKQEN